MSAICAFETVDAAVRSVIRTVQAGIPLARVELLDSDAIAAVNSYSNLNYPKQPTLFFEFQGTRQGVQEQAEQVGLIARDCGGGDFEWADKQDDRDRLWQARHDAYYAMLALRPNARSLQQPGAACRRGRRDIWHAQAQDGQRVRRRYASALAG